MPAKSPAKAQPLLYCGFKCLAQVIKRGPTTTKPRACAGCGTPR